MITIINTQLLDIDEAWVEAVVQHVLNQLGYETFDIGIMFTTDPAMQVYNETYRGKEGPTDILSFAYHDEIAPGERIEPISEDDENLGDLILAPAYIKAYTDNVKVPFEERLLILLIHGICHLIGYDHETDDDYQVMHALENKLFRNLPENLKR